MTPTHDGNPARGRAPRGRAWLRRIAWQGAVTLGFALIATRVVDVAALRAALAGVTLGWIPPALLLFTSAKFIDSWRWRYLLRGVAREAAHPPPQAALFGAFLIGNMANNLLPLRAGDVAKVQVLANRYGASRAGVAATVFIVEATLDGVVFVAFLLAAIAFWDLGALPAVSMAAVAVLVAAAAIALAVALALARGGPHCARALSTAVPARLHEPLRAQLAQAAAGLDALRSWRRAGGALLLSVPAWLVEAAMFALIGHAFGLDHGYATYVAAMISANLAVAVPVALWNFGPYEALVGGILAAAETEPTVAVSYALSVHLLTSVWINLTGLCAFWALGVRPSDVLGLRGPAPTGEPAAMT